MNITVIGATGGTGRLVIEQALARGHQVTAYVRQAQSLQPRTGLTIMTGQLNDATALEKSIRDADAVLCTLGTHERKNTKLMQTNLPLIINAMQKARTQRLVLLSAYGVGDTAQSASLIARLAYKWVVGAVYRDKEHSETALLRSGLDWTGIYPVILNDAPLSQAVEVRSLSEVNKVSGLPKVSRANVAKAMLDAAENPSTIGQRLLVTQQGTIK